jgi:hypothetical protein
MTCWCRYLYLTLLVGPTLIDLQTVYQNILDLRDNKHLKNTNIHNLCFENGLKELSTHLLVIPTYGKQYTVVVLK